MTESLGKKATAIAKTIGAIATIGAAFAASYIAYQFFNEPLTTTLRSHVERQKEKAALAERGYISKSNELDAIHQGIVREHLIQVNRTNAAYLSQISAAESNRWLLARAALSNELTVAKAAYANELNLQLSNLAKHSNTIDATRIKIGQGLMEESNKYVRLQAWLNAYYNAGVTSIYTLPSTTLTPLERRVYLEKLLPDYSRMAETSNPVLKMQIGAARIRAAVVSEGRWRSSEKHLVMYLGAEDEKVPCIVRDYSMTDQKWNWMSICSDFTPASTLQFVSNQVHFWRYSQSNNVLSIYYDGEVVRTEPTNSPRAQVFLSDAKNALEEFARIGLQGKDVARPVPNTRQSNKKQ